jgi:hypothetical protein
MKKQKTNPPPKKSPEQHLSDFFTRNEYYAERGQQTLISRKDRATIRSIVGHAIETAKIDPKDYVKMTAESLYTTANAKADIAEKTSVCDKSRYWLSQLIERICIEAQNDQMQGFFPTKNSW